jgi:hypothetical protein
MDGIRIIEKERNRQIEKEGWTKGHDFEHPDMTLAVAGASYVLDLAGEYSGESCNWKEKFKKDGRDIWPFDEEWFKPTHSDPLGQLAKAGALIAAEIDKRIEMFKRRALNTNNNKHRHKPYHTGSGEVICVKCGEPCSF